ncbi:MAG: amidase [Acidimicrobiales bacterium]
MEPAEYSTLDAVGLAALIAAGEVTAAEAADAARAVIDAVEPVLNGLAGPLFDEIPAADATGPLAGVPFLVKDLSLRVTGHPVEMGTRLLAGSPAAVATYDSDLTARMRRAGLAMLGRTTTPEMGLFGTTQSILRGDTRNPWDLTMVAGGSSGGSAALVAAGAVPAAHASDAGGSIRMPAARCGLVGLKPSRGRITLRPRVAEGVFGLGVHFAVCRTVRDLAALLDAFEGPGAGERYDVRRPPRPYAAEVGAPVERLRIAVTGDGWLGIPADDQSREAVLAVGEVLAAAGHQVTDTAPSIDVDAYDHATAVIWAVGAAEQVDALAAVTGRAVGPETVEPANRRYAEAGRRFTAVELSAALGVYDQVCLAVGRFWESFDLLVTPTSPTPAVPLSFLDPADEEATFEQWLQRVASFEVFTSLWNATGDPAVSLPLARSATRLPLGIQVVAPLGHDDRLVRVAAWLEQALPWADRRPPVHAAEVLGAVRRAGGVGAPPGMGE